MFIAVKRIAERATKAGFRETLSAMPVSQCVMISGPVYQTFRRLARLYRFFRGRAILRAKPRKSRTPRAR
jgi:hypothetical protein